MDSLLKNKRNEDIGKMFDDIAPKYDFLNHFLSFNIDKCWRKKIIRLVKDESPHTVLDVATGTADLSIMAARKIPGSHFTGVDISEKMLELGRKKICRHKLEKRIELRSGAAENLPFADNSFDNVMVAFGVRNFQDLNSGLKEMLRVIKPGKKIFILEFSQPRGFFKLVYHLYFKLYLPVAGWIISGNKAAYKYLHESVLGFPEGASFLNIMEQVGYCNLQQWRLSGGISTIYVGEKQKNI